MSDHQDGVDRLRDLPQHVEQLGRTGVVDARVEAYVLDRCPTGADSIEGLPGAFGGRTEG
jgi:hypothetical protein